MNVENNNPPLTEVENDSLQQCNHDNLPVYFEPLKAVLALGHFVFVLKNFGKSFVAKIIKNHQTNSTVCPYLPVCAEDKKPYINSPLLLLSRLSHPSCQDMVELVKTGCTTNKSFTSITGILFLYLADDVRNYLAHIQGMCNAFVICFKFCFTKKLMVPLSSSSFHCFSAYIKEVHLSRDK
jgi:hypothetical protein